MVVVVTEVVSLSVCDDELSSVPAGFVPHEESMIEVIVMTAMTLREKRLFIFFIFKMSSLSINNSKRI